MKRQYVFLVLVLVTLGIVSIRFYNGLTHLDNRHRNTTVLNQDTIPLTESRRARITTYKKLLDSLNTSLLWKPIKPNTNLWLSKNGELGIQTTEATEDGIFITKYMTHLWNIEKETPLNHLIDTASFQHLGNEFYKDKNHVYNHLVMAKGGFFRRVEDADPKSFQILGHCYAKDKNFIYESRQLKLNNVDYHTFVSDTTLGSCFAKDKNTYYHFDSPISLEEITDNVVKDQLQRL